MQGFNCCQAVVVTYADLYGYSEEEALKVSAGFGRGMGGLTLTCGAISALVILAGMENGATDAKDADAKLANFSRVRELVGKFKEIHGSTVCAELLKTKRSGGLYCEASEMTKEYYKKKPCINQVLTAAKIYEESLGLKEFF